MRFFPLLTLVAAFATPHAAMSRAVPPAPIRADSTEDTTQPRLTVDALHRMATFWKTAQQLPDSIKTVAWKAHVATILLSIEVKNGITRPMQLNVVNMVELAHQFPAVAAALQQVGLTPQQWEKYRRSLYTATVVEQVAQAMGQSDSGTSSTASAPPSVIWQNVAFLRTHQQDLEALRATGMWFPKIPRGLFLFQGLFVREDTLRINDSTRTAFFTMTNMQNKTRDFWLIVDCGTRADSLEHDDLLAASWRNQSSCATPWLIGYPRHIRLAAHERRMLPLEAHPYPTLRDGRYTARMVWVALVDDTNIVHWEFPVVYTKGPRPPRPARTHWTATLPRGSANTAVQATPAVLVLDNRVPTATFTLTNPGATATEVWFDVDCPWFRTSLVGINNTSQFESAFHARIPNVALWLEGYPQHVVLAPHERRTFSITAGPVVVFGDPVGNFYARLVYVQSPVLTVTPAGDTTYATPHGAINLVYHRGGVPLPLTMSQLHSTQQPDGTSQACVTVQQPGLGFVAVLHAEVDDARGRPVSARPSTGRIQKGRQAWGMDTTVAVYEVIHHTPENPDTDDRPKAPDPVCFALPNVAPGHYQVVVTATTLEDIAKRQPVRIELPWSVP